MPRSYLEMSIFTGQNSILKSLDLLEKGIDVNVLRRKVFANNIANVDVPHFKRSEVSFEAELKRAFDKKLAVDEQEPLRTNHPLHIQKRDYAGPDAVGARVHLDYNSEMRNDGNNVDIEDEVSKLVRNQLQYNLLVDRIASNFRKWNSYLRPSV